MGQNQNFKQRVDQLREEYGIGMQEAQRAIAIGQERFEGDDRKGAMWVHADSLAIHIKGGKEARERWNDNYVERRVQDLKPNALKP